jgi:hopanoid biosynthesis associated RND transporter like protein HpnN
VTITAVTILVRLSSRHAGLVILGFMLLALLCAGYFAQHFAITTDSGKLLSKELPWRQQEIKLDQAFPQRADQIVAVIDATTPEAADESADALVKELSSRHDTIRSVTRPDGNEFFAKNGLLFLATAEVRRNADELIAAQPFLGTLAADPTLRGVLQTLSQSIEGVRLGRVKLEDLRAPVAAIADALERLKDGKDPAFSWQALITGRPPARSDLRRFVNIQPVLDYGDLQPGGKATLTIRDAIAKLGLAPASGLTVRLTGAVALSDEEFGTIADGAELNGIVTALIVISLLWLALRQIRIVLAVPVSLVVGLVITASVGLMMVGALNLISVAFAVLFVGLGVDFGIQFSVRYRAERLSSPDLEKALLATARGVASPLLLPYWGPSTTRDAVGTVVDTVGDPVGWALSQRFGWGAYVGLGALDATARLSELKEAEDASIDFYAFLRSAYYQTRRSELREAIGLSPLVESPAAKQSR